VSSVAVDIELDLSVLEDFSPVLPCEGAHHSRAINGHIEGAPGAFFVVSPCCGPKIVQCAGRVAAMRFNGVLFCATCDTEHLAELYQFVPIGEVGL
jgi:hypothetical protein